VAKAVPDGYTLLVGAAAWVTIAPHIYRRPGYDPVTDFAPVSQYAAGQNLLVVNPSLPAANVKELIALMKARPNHLNMASAGVGASSHLASVMFTTMAGVDALHVPYKGAGPAIVAVIAGEAQWTFTPMQGPLPHVKSGKLRALAVGGPTRSQILPDVPTVAESAIPGFDSRTWYGILGPAGTPKVIVDKLHTAIVKAVAVPEMRDQFIAQGAEPTGNTPAEFARFVREENERMARVVKVAGIKPE
jgi:tripartite-type tricarboxylate transporter receptor subunit TctC